MKIGISPGYVFNRKTYTTVNGLFKALHADYPSTVSIGMVKDNCITCFAADRQTVTAIYDVTPPQEGCKQHVERVREITKDLALAAVASAYNTDSARKQGDVPMMPRLYESPAMKGWRTAAELPVLEQIALIRAYAERITNGSAGFTAAGLFTATELRLIIKMLEAA